MIELKGEGSLPRVAVVAGRKVGKAVERNRAKRKLRAAAQSADLSPATDYILIADADTSAIHVHELTDMLTAHARHSE